MARKQQTDRRCAGADNLNLSQTGTGFTSSQLSNHVSLGFFSRPGLVLFVARKTLRLSHCSVTDGLLFGNRPNFVWLRVHPANNFSFVERRYPWQQTVAFILVGDAVKSLRKAMQGSSSRFSDNRASRREELPTSFREPRHWVNGEALVR